MYSSSFPDPELIATLTARMLLEVEAVHFRSDPPFTLTSGLVSPVYIDCRKLISYPHIRSTLMDFAVSILQRDVGFEAFDAVAGGETAGIPFAAWIAERLFLPMQYVRKKSKDFGRKSQIEGVLEKDQNVLLVEDLMTDGGSKLEFCKAIRQTGAKCNHTFVLFFYDVFPQTRSILAEQDLALHALATWKEVFSVACEGKYFDNRTLSQVETFLEEPLAWSESRGGSAGPGAGT